MTLASSLRRVCLGLSLLATSLALSACAGFRADVPSSPPANFWYLYPSIGVHPGGAGHGGPPEPGLMIGGPRYRYGLPRDQALDY